LIRGFRDAVSARAVVVRLARVEARGLLLGLVVAVVLIGLVAIG